MNKRFQERMGKARKIVDLNQIKVLSRDLDGRIKNAVVPGSQAKLYEVIVRRYPKADEPTLTIECRLQIGDHGHEECKGGWSTVCYHGVAVLLQSAKDNKLDASICETEEAANRIKRFGGNVYKVQSTTNIEVPNPLWLVVNNPIPEHRPTADEEMKALGY